MLKKIADGVDHIYLACGPTDFRKQIPGLTAMVQSRFKLDPYASASLFLFCNRRRTAIKALRYDRNGFLLVSKVLMDDQKSYEIPDNPISSSQEHHEVVAIDFSMLESFPEKNVSREQTNEIRAIPAIRLAFPGFSVEICPEAMACRRSCCMITSLGGADNTPGAFWKALPVCSSVTDTRDTTR